MQCLIYHLLVCGQLPECLTLCFLQPLWYNLRDLIHRAGVWERYDQSLCCGDSLSPHGVAAVDDMFLL